MCDDVDMGRTDGRPARILGNPNFLGQRDQAPDHRPQYPECGIDRRVRRTRPIADERSPGSAEIGIECNSRVCRRGADPPKKPSGRAGPAKGLSSMRCVSAGNGCCIVEANQSRGGHPWVKI